MQEIADGGPSPEVSSLKYGPSVGIPPSEEIEDLFSPCSL